MQWMINFMGWFLIAVAILKILDWKKFASNFSMYDLIAMRSKVYSWSYPAIELVIGISFLLAWNIELSASILFVLMFVGVIGVGKAILEKKKIPCACLGKLGHTLNIKLTKFTLVEDILMGIMALIILFG